MSYALFDNFSTSYANERILNKSSDIFNFEFELFLLIIAISESSL